MNNQIYTTLLKIFILFQFVLVGEGSSERDKNIKHKITSVAESKDKTINIATFRDTLNSRAEFFANERFPIIILGMPNRDRPLKQVKKWGITHVHRYGMGKSIENDQAFFDRAGKYGIKVMSDLRAKYWLKKSREIGNFRKYINHFKKHSAFGFWYLSDEPDNKEIMPNELNPLHQILKEETPDIPVANAHAWTKNWYKYGNVQDILLYDYYPVYAEPFPKAKLNAWTSFTENAIKRGEIDSDLVFPILQIFNWRSFADDDQRKYRNYSVENLRYPNSHELRYMIFSSVALGARGIALFSYSRSKMIDPQWGNQILTSVLKEAKDFTSQIGNISFSQKYSTKKKKILLSVWSNESTEFIAIINTTSDTQKEAAIGVPKNILTNFKEFEYWGQTRKSADVTIAEEEFIINDIKPWEVIILKRDNIPG